VEANPTTDNPSQASDDPSQEQFGIHNIYVKDISFETPNSPQIFMEQWKPQVELEMSTDSNQLQDDVHEVVLNITATVKVGEKTAFLIEVHQAGIFATSGFAQEKLSYMLYAFFPNLLFPFARETISSIVTRGGFQPLLLAPVNFDLLYAQRMEQLKQKQANQPLN